MTDWSGIVQRLEREFVAPVGLLDVSDQTWLALGPAASQVKPPGFPPPEMAARGLLGQSDTGRVFLWQYGDEPVVWLTLPVGLDGSGKVWALIGFATKPGLESWGPVCPEPALHAWGQAVADRLDAEAQARLPFGARSSRRVLRRTAPLLDELIRRLRVSDSPDRFQLLATRALREELSVAAVAWVPASLREPVVVGGAVPDLSSEQYRSLIPETRDQGVWLLDHPGPNGLRRVVIVADVAGTATGWLVVVEPQSDRPIEAAEVELLRSVASLVVTQRANARLYADLKDLLFGVIRSLTSAIDAKDPYTFGHSERVARIAVRLGQELGLSPSQRSDLYLMGLLHDVGKIGVDDSILKKPGKLSPDEYRQIQMHVTIGVTILKDLRKLSYVLPGVRHHHENYDGTGYPDGLAGEQIPLLARVLAVADSYDAMSSKRPYRDRLAQDKIERIFREGAGRQWDPAIIEALFACRTDVRAIQSRGIADRSIIVALDNAFKRSECVTNV